MPVDDATNRERVRASREALILRIGREEYLRQESQKRKERRARARARTAPTIVPTPTPTPTPVAPVAPVKVRKNNVSFEPPTVKLEKTVPVKMPTFEQKTEEKEQKEQ